MTPHRSLPGSSTPPTRADHARLLRQDASGPGLWLPNNTWGFAGAVPEQDVGVAADGQRCDWRWPSQGIDDTRDDERLAAAHLRDLVRERRTSRSRKFGDLLPRPPADLAGPLFRA